jgi:glutathione S-transferase
VVDGQPIFESLAINLYLAQRFPSALSLGTTELQAQAVQWSLWAQSDVDPTIVAWFLNTHFLPPEKCNAALAAGALEALAKPMGVLERALASREWLLDDRFTVADLNVASTLYLAQKWNLPRPPRLGEWLQRCWSRPAAVKSRKLRGEAI